MEDLLNKFADKCNELLAITAGYEGLLGGTPLKKALEEQDRFLAIIDTFPAKTKTTEHLLSSRQAFLENRNAFLAMIHGFYVQAWLSFCDNVFERMLEKHFSGVQIYKIPPMPIQFISIEDTPDKLLKNIKYRVGEYFSNNIPAVEKHNILGKSLKTEMTLALKNNIKKHIIVRNVIQHNQGQLRERDLQLLGSNKLMYPCINGVIYGDYFNPEQIRDYRMKNYIIDDTVEIDGMVLDQVHRDFIYASKCLIG